VDVTSALTGSKLG